MARTPARKAGILDLSALFALRDGLSAGGRWIRTIGTPEREAYFFPGRNSLAGTASRRGRDVGSNGQRSARTATSAMAPSGNRPDLRISLLAGAHAVGPGQQVGAAGLVRPIFPGAPGLDRIGAVAPVAGLDRALRVLDPAAQLPRSQTPSRCGARWINRWATNY